MEVQKKIAKGYYEVEYKEYREDGTICGVGTEDFSFERLKELKTYEVLENSGKKTKESSTHKGGRTIWNHVTYFNVFERKTANAVAKMLYSEKEYQLRKF